MTSGRARLVAPRSWSLWSQPRRVITYVLIMTVAATATTLLALSLDPIPARDLGVFAVLVACCIGYGEASRRTERARRQYSGTPHIDLNSVWMFAAVLLLHPALTTALIIIFYGHRWLRVAHRVVHRMVFNIAASICSAGAAVGFLAAVGHYHAFADLPRDIPTFGLVAAAAAVFLITNTALVCTAVALSSPNPTLRTVTADWSDYALEAATLALGALLAWALADWPVMALPVIAVTLVLHGKVLMRQLREAARTDAKTGLLNTDAWYDAAHRELTRAGRHGPPAGLLMIDLDHFKRINDTYGHLAGDDALRAVAHTITEQVRGYDLVGRFGGEEFVVLLPATDPPHLVSIAERIRDRIAALVLPVRANHGTVLLRDITASIGIAVHPNHGDQLEQLFTAADTALLDAKKAGRNQVAYATEPSTSDPAAATAPRKHFDGTNSP
ncbi:MAG TPA: GGDEF domain-containing protein [Actinophytocola sp.]|nr:GGDEF domain-containing protein [Actinophytocola sp.]